QIGIIGEDVAAFPAAGDGDVKLFAVDGGERAGRRHEQDVIDGLALRRVRGDGIAVGEGVEPGRERATVSQGDAAVLDLPDLDTFAVDKLSAVVGLQEQPV